MELRYRRRTYEIGIKMYDIELYVLMEQLRELLDSKTKEEREDKFKRVDELLLVMGEAQSEKLNI